MDFGKVEYEPMEQPGRDSGRARLKLTLVGQEDEDTLLRHGLAGLRRHRIVRLAREARRQGSLLGYEDLSVLLLTSLATLKRDVSHIESGGEDVPLRGRRRRLNGVESAGGGNR